jgi:hypothetical protein
MSPVIRANWILLTVSVVLSLVIILHSRQQDTWVPITDRDTGQIHDIITHHGTQVFTRLRYQDKGWIDLATGNPVGDDNLPARLLHIARLPSLHHFSATDRDLKSFGLQPPVYTLQLDDLRINFGNIDPVTGLRYVQVDKQIHLISDGYTHYLSQKPTP